MEQEQTAKETTAVTLLRAGLTLAAAAVVVLVLLAGTGQAMLVG